MRCCRICQEASMEVASLPQKPFACRCTTACHVPKTMQGKENFAFAFILFLSSSSLYNNKPSTYLFINLWGKGKAIMNFSYISTASWTIMGSQQAVFHRTLSGRRGALWNPRKYQRNMRKRDDVEQSWADGVMSQEGGWQMTLTAWTRWEHPTTASPDMSKMEGHVLGIHLYICVCVCARTCVAAAKVLPSGRQGEMTRQKFLQMF